MKTQTSQEKHSFAFNYINTAIEIDIETLDIVNLNGDSTHGEPNDQEGKNCLYTCNEHGVYSVY